MKLTLKPDQLVGFVAFDSAQCTVPDCGSIWERHGFVPGCQSVYIGPPSGHWYSLPGPCPSQRFNAKTDICKRMQPGGRCDEVTGERSCTYAIEEAGEINLNELVGIHEDDYMEFCKSGRREYVKQEDQGHGITFWNGHNDPEKWRRRADSVRHAFTTAFPSEPAELDDPPGCR